MFARSVVMFIRTRMLGLSIEDPGHLITLRMILFLQMLNITKSEFGKRSGSQADICNEQTLSAFSRQEQVSAISDAMGQTATSILKPYQKLDMNEGPRYYS